MHSCLYECDVMHARFTPRAHRFVYRIFLFAFDLDELEELPRQLALFSLNRPNVYSFRDADFLPLDKVCHNPSSQKIPPKKTETPNLRGRAEANSKASLKASLFAIFRPSPGGSPHGAISGLKARVTAYAATHGVDLQGGRIVLELAAARRGRQAGAAEEERLYLAKRVGDFRDGGGWGAVTIVTEVERDRVEEVAEDPGQGDKHDAAALEVDALRRGVGGHPGLQAGDCAMWRPTR
jgi:hypothetical protein